MDCCRGIRSRRGTTASANTLTPLQETSKSVWLADRSAAQQNLFKKTIYAATTTGSIIVNVADDAVLRPCAHVNALARDACGVIRGQRITQVGIYSYALNSSHKNAWQPQVRQHLGGTLRPGDSPALGQECLLLRLPFQLSRGFFTLVAANNEQSDESAEDGEAGACQERPSVAPDQYLGGPAPTQGVAPIAATATRIADPRALPICREVLTRPEASPCSSSETPEVPAIIAVTKVKPNPRAKRRKPGRRSVR